METDPGETSWASYLECDDAKVSRSSRGTKYIVSGKSWVSKCSWTHDGLSRRKKGIVTPWNRHW